MGLCNSKPTRVYSPSPSTSSRSSSAPSTASNDQRARRQLTADGPLAGLRGRSQSTNVAGTSRGAGHWSSVLSSINNPSGDQRIARALGLVKDIYLNSATLRDRLDTVAREGGATIHIVADDETGHSYGHAATRVSDRTILLTESTASDIDGNHHQLLNTLLIELTNLGRATDFQQVNVEFAQGKIGVARAAHNKERVEYGTIEEMSRYYSEARPEIEAAGYGNPSLWYVASDAYTGVPSPSYQSFEDYYAVARNSGHTDVYTDFYTRWKNSMESSD
ncbi:hypothetical protein SAMN05192589_1273 [Paracidovorax valerianellae]|uniref:Uncharacterized protein n=1 Tax=Paracidovorax valerianellae TaxID=187868 RepID=A0A1G7F5R5_9BURK|nr:hypothetical protein SAMN05192589_1273 [Paracidovorax valerianellae]